MENNERTGRGVLDSWLLTQISKAHSLERLQFLRGVIQADKIAAWEYTTDKPYMEKIRTSWITRRTELITPA